ncbi:P-loop NTPase fold protein [Marinibaculum pumilum]|uniref:P-loop NTPase fold protein n=1 Tax=Marinibaculum pumilum TaxID=1766165 RepID=A0ABV7L3D8_9PROT
MWPDNETERDFLNFSGVADTVAEIIVRAQGRPISIGVSGAWGVGKSSMIKLIRSSLENHTDARSGNIIFVEFNAWLYQGYDDARAALLEVIATKLKEEAERRKTALDKAGDLLKRVNWLRAAKLTAGSGLALALGLPPVGLFADALQLGGKLAGGDADQGTIAETERVAGQVAEEASGLLKPRPASSPPREIDAIRKCFVETLNELGVKLVVLIDDLDRCLPPTTISTLEAIRLFLFLENTAFVIAADDTMIKHAVSRHFEGLNDQALVTNYFDKLIQVPIRVPPLGTQEVRAYMLLLFVDNSTLPPAEKEAIRAKVCEQLARTWRGERVDRAFMKTTHNALPVELLSQFDTAERLAPLMTTASSIGGNPRLIKRFLNALSIRMAISRAHSVGVDEAVLAKMLLFERCGSPAAYEALTKAVNNNDQGKPAFLAPWEEAAIAGRSFELEEPWEDPFIREWLTVPPRLAEIDLRGVLYVSREHAPVITPEDRLSSDAAEVLTAILEHPDMAAQMRDQLARLPRTETTIIMDRVLERARQVQEWGTPPILNAALAVAAADPALGPRIGAFLRERPPAQITPGIIPRIGDQPWAAGLLEAWSKSDVKPPVKNAIKREGKKHGNV